MLTVQGFLVDSFSVRGDKVKVVLKGNKDDIRAGAEDIGGVVSALEICCVGGEDAPVSCSLLRSAIEITTIQHPFIVRDFVVKPEYIKIKLEAVIVNEGTPIADIAKSLTLHAQEEDKPVELVLPS